MTPQNKWELVSERQLDKVMDDLYTLNDQTPKLRCKGKTGVPPSLIFGLDSKRGLEPGLRGRENQEEGHDEVETATIWLGGDAPTHKHEGDCAHQCGHSNSTNGTGNTYIDRTTLAAALEKIPKDVIYRVKGFVQTEESGIHILNWAFGRYDIHPLRFIEDEGTPAIMANGAVVRLTIMGERGEVERSAKRLAEALGCLISA
jgi:G3E family GTPase